MNGKSAGRRPGRPPGEQSDSVRQALLDATRELCIERGLDAASSKAIADRARVNPAMINYYFGSKESLCQAMMLHAMRPILAQIEKAESASADLPGLRVFLAGYMQTLARNPWLPRIIVREVLPANGRFRDLFFSRVGARAGRLLAALLEREYPLGHGPADPKLAMISVISLAVFPFLAAPVLDAVLDVDVGDDAFVERLIAHSMQVLTTGLLTENAS